MTEAPKTRPTDVAVATFLDGVEDPARRADCERLVALMTEIVGAPATMWGPSIVGFGSYHYRYDSGREGDMCLVGFSPRKGEISIYLNGSHVPEAMPKREQLLARLGRHRMGKGCLYVKRLADIDTDVLGDLLRLSLNSLEARNS